MWSLLFARDSIPIRGRTAVGGELAIAGISIDSAIAVPSGARNDDARRVQRRVLGQG